ncbi:Uncharacterized protein dnm_031380 [Desulfonema magnum]|uniref:Uncharacterized protein n=1 Tax=Desulfonema magnum TaxID=45655 RepID=A0A975BKH9_9BACT|nr:Uncharacterized protein dnm_031380 [Desulfonema magnum]
MIIFFLLAEFTDNFLSERVRKAIPNAARKAGKGQFIFFATKTQRHEGSRSLFVSALCLRVFVANDFAAGRRAEGAVTGRYDHCLLFFATKTQRHEGSRSLFVSALCLRVFVANDFAAGRRGSDREI